MLQNLTDRRQGRYAKSCRCSLAEHGPEVRPVPGRLAESQGDEGTAEVDLSKVLHNFYNRRSECRRTAKEKCKNWLLAFDQPRPNNRHGPHG